MVAYLSLSGSGREVGWGGRLFEAGRLLTFPANSRLGAYSNKYGICTIYQHMKKVKTKNKQITLLASSNKY